MKTSDDPRIYNAHRRYGVMAVLGLVVALLFAWSLSARFGWFDLIFLSVTFLFALVNLRWLFTRAELTPGGLTVHEPLAPPQHIDFRQMVAVFEAGRALPGLSIVYYPLMTSGLVDMDQPRTLFLPAMERQAELLSVLQHHTPD